MAGRRDGKYSYVHTSQSYKKQNSLLQVLFEEIDRDFAREVAAKVNKSEDDPAYQQVAEMFKIYKRDKFYRETIDEIKTGNFKI